MMCRMRDVIVGTSGHIDHGKTALVKALTGIDPDRLEEEKRRGITIDIGFAHTEIGPYRVGFIDVPGHERFVKNMLAGVGGVDVALLVVAATESVMPQTVEHLEICRLLDIRHGLVALTKRDEVEEDLLDVVRDEVRELTRGNFLEGSPILAVDSLSGRGIEELKQALLEVLDQSAQARDARQDRVFLLPIDRVFTIHGFGTVVTGTTAQGRLEKDAALAVYPSGRTGKVRGIQIFNQPADEARAGQRTALNLSGLDKRDLERGAVLAPPGVLESSSVLDVSLTLLGSSPRPLRHRAPIRFHHGSAELMGRVYLLEGTELAPGRTAPVQIRLDSPTVCFPGDHFVIRSYSPITTIGGGVILDNAPPRRSRKDQTEAARILEGLARRAAMRADANEAGFGAALVEYYVTRSGVEGVALPALVARTGRLEAALLASVRSIPALTVVPQEPPLIVQKQASESLMARMAQYVADFQAGNPLSAGVPREELKNRFLARASQAYFQYALGRLEADHRIRVSGGAVTVFGAEAELTAEQEEIRDAVMARIRQAGYQSPPFDDIVRALPGDQSKARDVCHFLVKRGALVRINSEIVLLPEQVLWLKEQVRSRFGKGQQFGVAEFKDVFGVSRKYAIPYLEFLDRERVTRRAGDKRIVL
jgi:selenocysteine-specific elongation factor